MMRKIVITAAACLWAVVSFANHWTPNVDFEFNTTLTGIVEIDGVEQRSETLELGVFCNGECRGSQMPVYVALLDRYVYFTQIYGLMTDEFTFKLYDHGADMELDLVSPDAVAFDEDGFGSLSSLYLLNFTEAVPSSYTVSVSPDPIAGGTVEGAGDYDVGATATLTATANDGYAFLNWTEGGGVVSHASTYSFVVTGNRDFVAHFIVSDSHWLPNTDFEFDMTLTAVVQVNGVEQRSENLELGVFCGDECRGSQKPMYIDVLDRYVFFTQVYGSPSDAFTFKLYDHGQGEELALVSPEAMAFNVDGYGMLASPQVLNFIGVVYQITVEANPEAGGVVTGAGTYDHEAFVTLTATANEGYNFISWTSDGTVVSTDPVITFMALADAVYVANFERITFTIMVTSNPLEGGMVTGGGVHDSGSTVTLFAIPNEGYSFVNWSNDGAVVSNDAEYTFTVTEAGTFVANFSLNSYQVTATANPSEGGAVVIGSIGVGEELVFDFENGWQGWTTLKGTTGNSPNNWRHNTEHVTYSGGNPHDWSSFGHNNSSGFMISESYLSATSANATAYGAVTPDNYLVSPQVRLGGSISFYAGARNKSYCAEKFSVMVSTTNNTSTDSFTTVATWILSLPSAGYTTLPYYVDLSAYSGMGYVAIRHHDCNNQWVLCVDDITIVEGPGNIADSNFFNYGETCVVTALPSTDFHFVNWTKNGLVVSTDETYSFIVTGNADYVANFVSDNSEEPVVITLNRGWNWIGYLPWTEMTINVALANLNPSDGDMLKSQSSFCTFNAATGLWEGALNTLTPGSGLIYLRNDETTSFSYPPDSENVVITLNPGWNWIAYLPRTEMSVNVALANLNPSDGDMLKTQSSFCTYNSALGVWEGALNTLTPGAGLIYLHNGEATSFSYPGN